MIATASPFIWRLCSHCGTLSLELASASGYVCGLCQRHNEPAPTAPRTFAVETRGGRISTYLEAPDHGTAAALGALRMGVSVAEVQTREIGRKVDVSLDGDVAEFRSVPVVRLGQGDFTRDITPVLDSPREQAGSVALARACFWALAAVVGMAVAAWLWMR